MMHRRELIELFSCGLALAYVAGCGPTIRSVGTVEKFQGQALNSDGKPLANILVILQPTQRGYEIELEANSEGKFSGEGIPGEYVYYFAESKRSKAKLPKGLPSSFLEPKMEHLVSVQPNADVVCKVE
jgi:hypothetical protein